MTIILCCGHKIDDFDDEVCLSLKDHFNDYDNDRIGRAVSYGGYCKKCAAQYEEWGMVLHNKQEEDDWLSGKIPDTEWQ